MLQVLAGGDVRDHAAVLRVELDLAVDPFMGDAGSRVEDRKGGLVAGALQGENHLSYSRTVRSTSSAASSCLSSSGAYPNLSLKSAGSLMSGRVACIMTPLGVK